MKNVLATLLLFVVTCAAQKLPAKQAAALHWNWRDVLRVGDQTIVTFKDISPAERTALLDAVAAQFKRDSNPIESAAQTRIKLVDLNGDGVPEVVAQPSGLHICSPTGNCPFWVFQKNGAAYRLILEKGAAQGFTIQPTRTNNFSDVVLTMHGSATETGLFVYRFLDGRYRRTGCYDANWTYLGKDGEYHDLKEPQIAPCAR